jgi:Ser/Thr protein kinase RdoA (MazF antagonist)
MSLPADVRLHECGPVAVLERVLDETERLALMQEALAELEPSLEQRCKSHVRRVHVRSAGGYVAEIATVDASGETRKYFIEVPAEPFADRAAEIVRRCEKQRERLGQTASKQPAIHANPQHRVFVRTSGSDEMIDGLVALEDGKFLSSQLPDNPDVATINLLAHRLNRRAVLSIEKKDGSELIVKLYKKGSSKPGAALAITSLLERTSLGKSAPISVPQGMCALHDWPGYVMNRAPGVHLADNKTEDRTLGLTLAGEALARLHRLPLRLQHNHALTDELALLQNWTKLVSTVFPAQEKNIRAALQVVSRELLGGGETDTTLVHRDFHGGQVLVSGSRATLIDFDTVCNGEPAQDIGNFLGHLDLARLERGEQESLTDEMFLSGYINAHRVPNAARIQAHRRATQLRLACIHAFSDSHRTLWPQLLDLARGGRP